jgi:hypothetical protein
MMSISASSSAIRKGVFNDRRRIADAKNGGADTAHGPGKTTKDSTYALTGIGHVIQ